MSGARVSYLRFEEGIFLYECIHAIVDFGIVSGSDELDRLHSARSFVPRRRSVEFLRDRHRLPRLLIVEMQTCTVVLLRHRRTQTDHDQHHQHRQKNLSRRRTTLTTLSTHTHTHTHTTNREQQQ